MLLNSSVTQPSHSGSEGVPLTMIPQRAWLLLPRQMVSRFLLGIRKYSAVRARAKLFGGMTQTSPAMSTNLFSSKFFGSTTVE